jgi:hypothetical protein
MHKLYVSVDTIFQPSISFNFTFRYINDDLSVNSSKCVGYVGRTYPTELQITDSTDTARHASYLDLHLEIDSEGL